MAKHYLVERNLLPYPPIEVGDIQTAALVGPDGRPIGTHSAADLMAPQI
jgi:hypothetical protein